MPVTTLSTSANASLMPYDTVMVGHSLVNHDLPQMLRQLSPVGSSVQEQVINGAPLRTNWDLGYKAEGIDARSTLAKGGTDVLVITEAVPLQSHIDWNDSYGYALRWRNAAVEANPGARVYLYETWHSLTSGQAAWRNQLTTDIPKWKAIAEAGQMTSLIPAGQAMAEIYDEIQLGTVPTLTSITDLFTDDIHPNHLGLYLIACVHYAVIYNTSPVGLPRELVGQWGTPYQAPSEALALRMQQIAWEVVADSAPDTGTPPPQPPTQVPTRASVSGDYIMLNDVLNVTAIGRGSVMLTGNALSNTMKGNVAKNVIKGEIGNDKIDGRLGNDTLFGGVGKDAFCFTTKLGTSKTDRKVNFDKIADFSVKDDSIWLDNAIFKKLGSGSPTHQKQLSKFYFSIDKAKDSNDYVIYNKKTGVLSYDVDGSGAGDPVEFAQLKKGLGLTHKDFFIM